MTCLLLVQPSNPAAPQVDPVNALQPALERLGFTLKLRRSAYDHQAAIFTAKTPYADQAAALVPVKEQAAALSCDVLCADRFPHLKRPGGVIMDMDMTAVTIEGIDEIARSLGVYEQVAALTASAMHGRSDFATSLRNRVALLKGGNASVIEDVKARMGETPGLNVLLTVLQKHGFKRGIASGGFTQLICVLERKYQLELVRANTLGIEDGHFTGAVVGPIVDGQGKLQALNELRARYAIAPEQIMALGDGANDLLMLKGAGVGVAYHAKPAVVAQAQCALNFASLAGLTLCLELYAEVMPV